MKRPIFVAFLLPMLFASFMALAVRALPAQAAAEPTSSLTPVNGTCPEADAAARAAREAGQRLRKMLDVHDDADGNAVSAPEREAIGAYKRALADAIDARLACDDEKADPAVLQKTLAAALGAAARTAASGSLFIDVERGLAPRPLMLVRANFAIPCGDDNLLAGYAWQRGGWRRVLDWQSGAYDMISGAYGDSFSFVALPGGQVVVAYGTPWCTSSWSVFHADVIMPANDAAAQRLLFHMETGYFRGDEVGIRLKKVADGFELRATVSSRDADVLTRPGIYRYRVDGDTVRRVQPAAANGRGFVDEWLGVDDILARDWSDSADAAAASLPARQRLLTATKATDAYFSYGPVRACATAQDRYQVEMRVEKYADAGKSVPPPQKWYALIRQEKNGFAMLGLSTTADAACNGPDLMVKRGQGK